MHLAIRKVFLCQKLSLITANWLFFGVGQRSICKSSKSSSLVSRNVISSPSSSAFHKQEYNFQRNYDPINVAEDINYNSPSKLDRDNLENSNIEPNLRIFDIYDRLETEEERLKRVAELKEKLELQAKDKKGAN